MCFQSLAAVIKAQAGGGSKDRGRTVWGTREMLCNMPLKQKLAPCSLAPVLKVVIPFPSVTKEKTERAQFTWYK